MAETAAEKKARLAAEKAAAEQAEAETIQARVLVDTSIGGFACECNEVVEGDKSLLEQAEKEGKVDCERSAIDYALEHLEGVRVLGEESE